MDLNNEYLKNILGAHLITRTVLNHYYEDFPEELLENKMLHYFQELCQHLKLTEDGYKGLIPIFDSLYEYRKNKINDYSI